MAAVPDLKSRSRSKFQFHNDAFNPGSGIDIDGNKYFMVASTITSVSCPVLLNTNLFNICFCFKKITKYIPKYYFLIYIIFTVLGPCLIYCYISRKFQYLFLIRKKYCYTEK